MASVTAAKSIFPAKPLFFNACASRLFPYIFTGFGCSVSFAETMSAGNKCNSFFIVHSHTAESFTYVAGCSQRITNRP